MLQETFVVQKNSLYSHNTEMSILDVLLSFIYTYATLEEKRRPVKLHPDNSNINGLSAIFFSLPSVTLLGVPILWPTIILMGIINLFS